MKERRCSPAIASLTWTSTYFHADTYCVCPRRAAPPQALASLRSMGSRSDANTFRVGNRRDFASGPTRMRQKPHSCARVKFFLESRWSLGRWSNEYGKRTDAASNQKLQ